MAYHHTLKQKLSKEQANGKLAQQEKEERAQIEAKLAEALA
jgi:hypothetical protein